MLVADANTRVPLRATSAGGCCRARARGPPGIARAPRAGEVFVSPALAELLATPDGRRLLAPRMPGRVVGEIAPAGLLGPTELAFYAGTNELQDGVGSVRRIDHFGSAGSGAGMNPTLALLIVIVLVALLLPVAVLVGAAVRTGGEDRDRRLAALRLIGADQRMARRIAAGEALVSAAAGLLAGALAFLVARSFADRVSIWDSSVYSSDVEPTLLLGAAVVVGVPAAAVFVSLLALRRVVAEPLGVVRRAEAARRRRLWWRLLLPAVGLLALVPAAGKNADDVGELRVAVGVIALLIGVAALLPWVVERVVGRLGAGKVAWQLAVRRLQLDPGGPARAVSGITVAVAGAIALQMVFTGIQDEFKQDTGADLDRASLYAELGTRGGGEPSAAAARATASRRPRSPRAWRRSRACRRPRRSPSTTSAAIPSLPESTLTVAPCASLREVVGVTTCHDGDVFFTREAPRGELAFGAATWTVPEGARQVPTPPGPDRPRARRRLRHAGRRRRARAAEPVRVRLRAHGPGRPRRPGARPQRAAALDQRIDVVELRRTRTDAQFSQLRRAMLIGASIVIGLIGLSLLLTALEQLRERRRLLAVLVAFGTRRSTLSWSVLWQSALPVALGIAIAVATGIALGSVLLRILDSPVQVAWADVAAMAGVGIVVVLAVTAASLPVLWRTMRPEGLRTE